LARVIFETTARQVFECLGEMMKQRETTRYANEQSETI